MKRTYAMNAFLVADLGGLVALVLAFFQFVLPNLNTPDAAAFLPVFVVFGVLEAVSVAAAWLWSGAPSRGWFWVVAALPGVAFFLLNATFIWYDLIHPGNSGFPLALLIVVSGLALVVAAYYSFREARRGAAMMAPGRPWTRYLAFGVAVATVTAFVISTLASGGSSAGATFATVPKTTAVLTAKDTKYAPTSFDTKIGEPLGLFIVNQDTFDHSFDIDSLNIHIRVPASGTTAVVIPATAAGSLQYYCAVPGHKDAGMLGQIAVKQ